VAFTDFYIIYADMMPYIRKSMSSGGLVLADFNCNRRFLVLQAFVGAFLFVARARPAVIFGTEAAFELAILLPDKLCRRRVVWPDGVAEAKNCL